MRLSGEAMLGAVIWDFGGVLTSSPFEAFARFETERGLPADIIRRTKGCLKHGGATSRMKLP